MTTSKLKTNTMLKSNKPLKSRSALKPSVKPKKQPKPSVSKLKKRADQVHSLATRLRFADLVAGEWIGKCVTCSISKPIKQLQCGHFIRRDLNIFRYDEENTAPICEDCNYYKYAGNANSRFAKAIDLLYGSGTAERLKKESKQRKQFSVKELEEIIKDRQEQIKWYTVESMSRSI